MAHRQEAQSIIRFHTPELPELDGDLKRPCLASQIFLENCGERLTALAVDGSTKLQALDTVSMSLDGLTQRLTLKKDMMFHCGAEVTSVDAIQTITRVLKNDRSASQLHRCIARDRTQPHGYAVYAISRYKFEIKLTQRIPDLLARLALTEFTLRHEGRLCFSGLWKMVEQDSKGLLLNVHASHPRAADCQYQGVRWERIDAKTDGAVAFGVENRESPVVMVYPGTFLKSPPEELLVDEICRPLEGGLSLFAKLPPTDAPELRARLQPATKAAFGGNSLWRRAPLQALVPKGHALYTPFPGEAPPHHKKRLKLTLDVEDRLIPPQLWEKLAQVLGEEQQVDLFKGAGPNAAPVVSAFYGHPADAFTALQPFAGQPGEKPDRSYAPLLSVPFIVRANRNIRRSETTGLLHFIDVRQSADRVRKVKLKETAQRALGDALQMFVHDVRRPFSLVQGLLGLIEAADSPDDVKRIVSKYGMDVRRAVTNTDRLIQDVLEIGSDADPARELLEVDQAIDGVLREIFAVTPTGALTLEYKFGHRHKLHADPLKLNRVLTNLVVNAVEAMKGQGKIWFETAEHPTERQMLLTVGNTNSYIPADVVEGLFERFFTEGKQRGTGLGLAIVKKVVNDHGGDVWCESDQKTGTRFTLALPLALEPSVKLTTRLPRAAAEIVQALSHSVSAGVDECMGKLASHAGLGVLLVDDDPVYQEVIKHLLSDEEKNRGQLEFYTARGPEDAEAHVQSGKVQIAVVDVDLGRGVMNGLGVARRLRTLSPALKICVHSHGAPFALTRQALAAGGDLFLPKPMSRDHLVKLLDAFAQERSTHALGRVAVVDDDALMLEMWQSTSGPEWLAYESPEEFLAAADADPALLASLTCVITDLSFAKLSPDGYQLAEDLKKRRPELKVYVATNRPVTPEDRPKAVNSFIPKAPAAALALIAQDLAK